MRLFLNVTLRDNYSFYDPKNNLHLNHVNPLGKATVVSESIKRAVKAGTVIDIDRATGIECVDEKLNDKVLKYFGIERKIQEVKKVKEDTNLKEQEEVINEELAKEAEENINKPKNSKKKKGKE